MSMVCKDCGTVGHSSSTTRGSILIEIILWLCFIIPGLIYSFWRLSTRHPSCPACGSKNIVPLNSPIGSKLATELGHVAPPAPKSGAEAFGRSIGKMFASKK